MVIIALGFVIVSFFLLLGFLKLHFLYKKIIEHEGSIVELQEHGFTDYYEVLEMYKEFKELKRGLKHDKSQRKN